MLVNIHKDVDTACLHFTQKLTPQSYTKFAALFRALLGLPCPHRVHSFFHTRGKHFRQKKYPYSDKT